jgi:hypothetical protein
VVGSDRALHGEVSFQGFVEPGVMRMGFFDSAAVKKLCDDECNALGRLLAEARMILPPDKKLTCPADPFSDSFKQAFSIAASEIGRDKALQKAVKSTTSWAMTYLDISKVKYQKILGSPVEDLANVVASSHLKKEVTPIMREEATRTINELLRA